MSSIKQPAEVASPQQQNQQQINNTPPQQPTQVVVRLQGLCAGGAAGAFAKTATAPFDRVKILCQTGRVKTPWNAIHEVYNNQGIPGFWKGNMASILRIVPNRGVLFMTSDFIKDSLRQIKGVGPDGKQNPLGIFDFIISGSVSGGVTVLATYPLDFIRGRMTGHVSHFTSIGYTVRYTLKNEGWRTFYRGMSISLLGSFPYEGIRFGVYDMLKSRFLTEESPIYYNVIVGAIAGLCATSALYPNDTVRRRLQIQEKKTAGASYFTGGFDAYRRLYREHGIKVFYRGLTANLARAAPSAALQFSSYEFLKRQFAAYNKKSFNYQ